MIEEFVSYLESEQRASAHTIEAYERDVSRFAEWLHPDGEPDWSLVSASDIREWIGSLADSGLVASTLRRKAQSLRAFYHWGHKKGLFKSNPASQLPLVKKGRHLPDFIKESDIEKLLAHNSSVNDDLSGSTENDPEAQNGSAFSEARTHIVLTLLYSLGLRQAELLGITDNDLSADGRELRVLGKRNKQRIVPVPPALAAEIRDWQQIRDTTFPDLEAPRALIAGRDGKLSKTMLYRIVREGLKDVPTGRKSPHTLRHTFATAMLNHGADIDAVREMLGHASLQTTQIYTHISYKELLANYKAAHPRAANKVNKD